MADVTVKLVIGAFSVELSGDSDYVDKKLEELVSRFLTSSSWRGTASQTATQTANPPDQSGKKTSAGEFLKKSTVKNQVDRALALGYYLEKLGGMSAFTSTDLSTLGRETKNPFTNASDAVAKLTARGLMMSAGDKDGQRAYALTASGEAFVETLLESKS
jgi:hypothetical protein